MLEAVEYRTCPRCGNTWVREEPRLGYSYSRDDAGELSPQPNPYIRLHCQRCHHSWDE